MIVFVYGTLADPERAATVLDSFAFEGSATLEGCHRVAGRYPTLAPRGSTDGRLLRTDEIDALDRYEGVERGLYVRVTIPSADDSEPVATYVGDPARLGVEASVEWPAGDSLRERVERHVREAGVVVRRT